MSHSGYTYDEQGYDELEIPRASASFRVSRKRPGRDRTTRNMVAVAAGIAAVIVVAVGVQAMLRPSGLPVVAPPAGPWRVKPANPGGMQVTGAGNAIYSGTQPVTQDQVMPGPEKPDLAALARDEHDAAPQAPAAAAPPAPTAASGGVAAMAPPPPAPAPAAPTPQAAAQPAARTAPATAPAAGGAQVQLAALPSEEAARVEWQRLSRRMPGLLGHRAPLVTRAVVNGRTWWRLRTGGFASFAAARGFCTQVKAQGGACAPEGS